MAEKKYRTSLVELLDENGEPGPALEMVHDKDPGTRFLPMVAAPRYFIGWAQDHPDDPDSEAMIADMRRLQDWGVPSLPLYESRAKEAGLRWRPVS